ncbi:unnamed protein product [Linum trigynum]|uniref:Uncharacterized protein n=1 Tax=Linum trigynum TaxID=586398 RepID=A0AAV2F8G0_9ROSI
MRFLVLRNLPSPSLTERNPPFQTSRRRRVLLPLLHPTAICVLPNPSSSLSILSKLSVAAATVVSLPSRRGLVFVPSSHLSPATWQTNIHDS